MRSISKAYLYERSARDYVEVDFIDGVAWEEIEAAQAAWKPAMNELLEELAKARVPRDKWPEHAHWDWRLKALKGIVEGQRFFGLRYELQMQGLMMLVPKGGSKLAPGQSLVYIDYLATAPWNLPYETVQAGRFKQVGRVLLAAAIQLSAESGFDGRVGLLSLPQAEPWYKSQGMVEVPSAASNRLKYFELTPNLAQKFLLED